MFLEWTKAILAKLMQINKIFDNFDHKNVFSRIKTIFIIPPDGAISSKYTYKGPQGFGFLTETEEVVDSK